MSWGKKAPLNMKIIKIVLLCVVGTYSLVIGQFSLKSETSHVSPPAWFSLAQPIKRTEWGVTLCEMIMIHKDCLKGSGIVGDQERRRDDSTVCQKEQELSRRKKQEAMSKNTKKGVKDRMMMHEMRRRQGWSRDAGEMREDEGVVP